MKKIIVAVAAVAMAMTSMAATSVEIYAKIDAYSDKDTQPGASHTSWYSMYSMTAAQAQNLMGASSFAYEAFNSWLGADFSAHSALVKENTEGLACSGFSTGWFSPNRYAFENDGEDGLPDSPTIVGVWFFDNGTDLAYYTAGMDEADSYYFGDVKNSADYASGWQPVSVPEPTSGLLMLLGLAGLALRRRRA